MPHVEEVSGRLNLSETISAAEGKRRNLTYFEDGDVIFAKITPCMENGKIALAEGLTGGAAFGSTEFHVLRPSEVLDARYLRFFLVQDDFRAQAAGAMTGAVGQRRVPKTYLAEHPIPLPPIDEQRRIVAILEDHLSRLDTVSRSLQNSAKLNNTLWASQVDRVFDLGGSTRTAWPLVQIGSVAEFVRGVTYKKPEASPEGGKGRVALITASNIINDSLDFGNLVYVPMTRVNSRQMCQVGDIVVATSSGSSSVVGKSALVREDLEMTFGAFCGLLRPMSGIEPRFLAHVVQSRTVRSSWSALARGTNINNLKATQIAETVVPLPPIATQQQLADTLDEARGQTARLERQLSFAMASGDALRRAILNAAFSGQLTRESIIV